METQGIPVKSTLCHLLIIIVMQSHSIRGGEGYSVSHLKSEASIAVFAIQMENFPDWKLLESHWLYLRQLGCTLVMSHMKRRANTSILQTLEYPPRSEEDYDCPMLSWKMCL